MQTRSSRESATADKFNAKGREWKPAMAWQLAKEVNKYGADSAVPPNSLELKSEICSGIAERVAERFSIPLPSR